MSSLITIGNDVVDLHHQAKEPQLHPRYINRILSNSEKDFFAHEPTRLWEFWAAKEAAYKALKRVFPRLIFAPSRFIYTPASSIIHYEELQLECHLQHEVSHIAVTCVPKGTPSASIVISVAATSSNNPSYEVRTLTIDALSKKLGISQDDITLTTQATSPESSWSSSTAIPVVEVKNYARYPVSFSHHGTMICSSVLLKTL